LPYSQGNSSKGCISPANRSNPNESNDFTCHFADNKSIPQFYSSLRLPGLHYPQKMTTKALKKLGKAVSQPVCIPPEILFCT